MNATLRRLVTLHRVALGRWNARASRRGALIAKPGPLDLAAYSAHSTRMDALDAVMSRLQLAMLGA